MALPSGSERIINLPRSAAAFNVLGMVQEAVAAANSRTSQQLLAFARDIAGPKQSEVQVANERLAQLMRQSIRGSFGQAKGKFRNATYDPLRPRFGRKGGRDHLGLQKIIDSDYLVQADARGISLGPIAQMDRDARHWARINFGAGPAGQGSNERFSVRFSNLGEVQYGFVNEARPGYRLPVGVWKEGAFYPRGEPAQPKGPGLIRQTQPRETKGNIGYQFLDAGVAAFFRNFPQVYGQLFRATSYTGGRPFGISSRGFSGNTHQRARFTRHS